MRSSRSAPTFDALPTPIFRLPGHAMTPRQRTTFDKLQRERARHEKQAQKRAHRQAKRDENTPERDADAIGENSRGHVPPP